MRFFGRKKKQRRQLLSESQPRSKQEPTRVANGKKKCTASNNNNDNSDNDSYSCKFSTDQTYCTNPSLKNENNNFFSVRKSVKKSAAATTTTTKPTSILQIDSPPRLQRTHRLPENSLNESAKSKGQQQQQTATSSLDTQQQSIPPREGLLVFMNEDSGGTGSISSLSTPDIGSMGSKSKYSTKQKQQEKQQGTPVTLSTTPGTENTDFIQCLHYNNHKFDWFPGMVALSVLDDRREVSISRTEDWGEHFVSQSTRMVRRSCTQHLKLHAVWKAIGASGSCDGNPVDIDAYDMFLNKDTNSVLMQDHSKAGALVKEFVCADNLNGAITIAKVLLQRQQSQSNSDPISVATLARQLILLSLAAGRSRDTTAYSALGVQSVPKATDVSHRSQTNIAITIEFMMGQGLMYFGTNKAGQAILTWREAIHIAIAVNGYQDKTVAMLLNGIGVVHLECGDIKSSLRSLEESLELQRGILRSSGSDDSVNTNESVRIVEHAIFGMAITMGNLAIVCERDEQLDRSIALLEEALALLQSITIDSTEFEEIVMQNMEFLEEKREALDVSLSSSLISQSSLQDKNDIFGQITDGNSAIVCNRGISGVSSMNDSAYADDVASFKSEETNGSDEGTVDSARSNSLFGNSDGVPDRKLAVKLTMEMKDNHDFLLLGRLSPEPTAEERVRETTLAWYGKRIDGEKQISFDLAEVDRSRGSNGETDIPNKSIVFDADKCTILDAELHLSMIYKMAMDHLDKDEISDALRLFSGALRSHRKKYGDIHHLVGTALHNIGMVNIFAKRYEEALLSFDEAVRVRTEALGLDHPDVQSSRMKIALIHMAAGNFAKASEMFCGIRDKFLDLLAYGHPQLAKILNNVGVVAYELDDHDYALKCFEMSFEFQRRILEERDECESPTDQDIMTLAMVNSLCNIAFMYAQQDEMTLALERYEQAAEMLRKNWPRKHYRMSEIRENIDYLIRSGAVQINQNETKANDGAIVSIGENGSIGSRGPSYCGEGSCYFSMCFQ